MIKVTALTSGKNVPSTRFRVHQHIQPLHDMGIEVRDYTPLIQKYASIPRQSGRLESTLRIPGTLMLQGTKLTVRLPGVLSSWTSQVTWLERELLPGYFTLEQWLKHPLVFDVDDAIWLSPPRGESASRRIAKSADIVIAGNRYLADWFSDYARDIRIVPTAVDTERFVPLHRSRNGNEPFTIGWTGTVSTIPYLEALDGCLGEFIQRHRDVQIVVIADVPPKFNKVSLEHVRYIPWSPEKEVEIVQMMDVGIMPLPDSDWTRGKCSFKLLQYMACGVPAIVSPVGMNRDVLNMAALGLPAETDTDWLDALELFYDQPDRRTLYGSAGRSIAESHFSRKVVAHRLAAIFTELA